MHYEFDPRGQATNKEYYVEVLKRLRDAVRRRRPRLWSSGDWLLHHDNAPAHSSNLVACAAIFSETQDCTRTASPSSIQSRHSSLRLLDIPKIENAAQRKAVR